MAQPSSLRMVSPEDEIPTDLPRMRTAPKISQPGASPPILQGTRQAIQKTGQEIMGANTLAGAVGAGLRNAPAVPLGFLGDTMAGPVDRGLRAVQSGIEDFGRGLLGSRAGQATPDGPQASYSNERRNYPAAAAKTQPAGAPGLRQTDMGGGSTRTDGGSSPLFSNASAADNAALMSRGPMSAQNQGALDGIQGRQDAADASRGLRAQYGAQVADAARINAAGAALPEASGFGLLDKNRIQERNLRMDVEQGKRGALTSLRAFQQERGEAPKLAAERAAKERTDATTRRGQDLTDSATRRGQDASLAGDTAKAEASNRSLRYNMAKDERDFNTGRSDKAFEQAQTARKNFTERAATMFPGKDGKPDAQKVADYTSFVTRDVAATAAKMMKEKDPATRAAGQRLAQGDMSVLDATDFEKIDKKFMLDDRTKNSGGLMPFSGSGTRSIEAGSSEIVGRDTDSLASMFQRRVKLADGRVVPESDVTGAGWLDDGDQYLIPQGLRIK